MNPPPAHPPTDANASHSMIALIVWCGLNAAALVLAKIGFRPSASSEPISATAAVLIAQILGAAYLFPDLLRTWWHAGRVVALSAAALAIAVRQDRADWAALPATWLVAAAWTTSFAAIGTMQTRPRARIVLTAAAGMLLIGIPALTYLHLETSGTLPSPLSLAISSNPLQIVEIRNFHFPPPITLFAFPMIFGGFALLARATSNRPTAPAPGYPQK